MSSSKEESFGIRSLVKDITVSQWKDRVGIKGRVCWVIGKCSRCEKNVAQCVVITLNDIRKSDNNRMNKIIKSRTTKAIKMVEAHEC